MGKAALVSIDNIVLIRDMLPSDRNFVAATWIKGLRVGNPDFKVIPKEMYFDHYNKVIKQVLDRARTRVSVLKDEPDVILAWAVTEKNILHYCYCKPAWRRLGLVKRMVPSATNTCSHLTEMVKPFLPRKIKYVQYEKLEKQFQ